MAEKVKDSKEFFNKISQKNPSNLLLRPNSSAALAAEAAKYKKSFLKIGPDGSDEIETFMEENIRLVAILGKGCFGVVYLGQYLGDDVVVKIRNNPDGGASQTTEEEEQMFINEACLVEEKRSNFIVRLWHYCRHKQWIVSEYCKNGTLNDFMRNTSNENVVEDWNNRLRWLTDVAIGMYSIHEERPGILHRDLKLSNIFLNQYLEAKIGDIGFSMKIQKHLKEAHLDENNKWMARQAPEVKNEQHFSKKSDVYCFGIIMHELLMLSFPYTTTIADRWADSDSSSSDDDRYDLRVPENRSSLPGKWKPCLEQYITLMEQCCAYNPNNRPHFRDISADLKELSESYKKAVECDNNRIQIYPNRFAQFCEQILQILAAACLAQYTVQSWMTNRRH